MRSTIPTPPIDMVAVNDGDAGYRQVLINEAKLTREIRRLEKLVDELREEVNVLKACTDEPDLVRR